MTFSIKQSLADCSKCKLLDAPSCIMDTNSKADLTQVDIVIVAENPGKDEIKKEVPLIGKSGKTFRKYFDKYIKQDFKWLMTNCVLCLTLDENGNTGNPDDEIIERCKINCFDIIETCNPKLILIMGTSPMKAFGIAKAGITDLRGTFTKWNDRDILITVHPSFVNRNRSFEEKFENDIKLAAEFLGKKFEDTKKELPKKDLKKGIQYYKIPEKYYTDQYRLVDIQYISKKNKVLYIFRDKDNNKVYHEENDNYYFYTCPKDVKRNKIIPYDNLYQSQCRYGEKNLLDSDITYEGDMKITQKHAIDYYLQNKGEAPRVDFNIMFLDIEVDTKKVQIFPDPKEAKFPINLITTSYHKKLICYILDNGSEEITPKEGVELKIFKNELSLMKEFIKDFKNTDCDFITGWNSVPFDFEYIFNRLKQLKIPQESFSKFGEFYVEGSRFICNIAGCVPLDQMHLYKMFTFTKKESYALGFIGQEEVGMTKLQMELPFHRMYYEMLNKFIEYNIRDTELLVKLEDKLNHVNFLNEIRTICNTSFDSGSAVLGQVDSLTVSYLKEKGLASKNGNPHIEKENYPGAFVYEPIPGIYDNITDFDFSSLYPSLIITYNIGPNNFILKLEDEEMGYDLLYNPDSLPENIDVIIDPMESAVDQQISSKDLVTDIKKNNWIVTINGCVYESHENNESVYSGILSMLLSSRKVYKKKMLTAKEAKNDSEFDYFYTRQYSYKVLANSLYGAIANKIFRFFDRSCAAAITLGGQEALKWSIIEGNEFMSHLKTGKELKRGKPLTKKEMYDAVEMDKRKSSTPYIITGDTDSIFTCFNDFKEEKSDENILKWCELIQTYLNKTIMKELVERHNVPFDKNKLELKNELIISRGLFLAKKRYAIRVVNQEGKKIDDISYMGLEIKRSDYASKSKEFMKGLLDLILKSEKISLHDIYGYINMQEKEFIDLIKKGDKSIARPVSYGKQLKDYKTIPQGVKSMVAWNEIMYHIHNQGSKAYMFRVMGIDKEKAPEDIVKKYEKFIANGNKFEVIAIPDVEPCLPSYIIPDLKSSLQFAFHDRHDLLLKPIAEVKQKTNVLTF